MNRIFCFALLAVLLALSTTPTFSQAFYGSIVGTITDPTGGAAASAAVALTNISTGERRQALAGTSGEYQFLNLVPGIYRVEVEQRGFKRASRDNIEVTVSGTVRADVSMQLGEITQTVEVQATAPLLRTEDANLSQVVSTRAVEELPVNGRNILNLTALVPGVVPQGTTDGNAITGKNIFAAGQLPDRRRHGEPGRGLLRRRSGQLRAGQSRSTWCRARTRLRSSACRPTATTPNSGATRAG